MELEGRGEFMLRDEVLLPFRVALAHDGARLDEASVHGLPIGEHAEERVVRLADVDVEEEDSVLSGSSRDASLIF